MKIRYVIVAAVLATVAACSSSPTATPDTRRVPTTHVSDGTNPPPDSTNRGGGTLGSGG